MVVHPIIATTYTGGVEKVVLVHSVVGSGVLMAMRTLFGHIMQPQLGMYDVRERIPHKTPVKRLLEEMKVLIG